MKAKSLTVVSSVPQFSSGFINNKAQYPRSRFVAPSARTPLCEKQTLLFLPRIGPVSVFHPNSTIEEVCSIYFSPFFFLISFLLVALDTTSPLPLFNSLHHLTYLTSTSPRIREIMTMDGGLERLVRILHDFCMCPPPPENPNVIYGLSPPNMRPPKLMPTLNPPTFDKHAAYRFSLAFQCVVNIGVRGSEPIRSRVVQAGTLDVVGCILEAWLANKGFAVGPSSSATGLPRESREQRLARRQALAEQRQRDGAAELTRALQRQIAVEESLRQGHINTEANGIIDEVDRALCHVVWVLITFFRTSRWWMFLSMGCLLTSRSSWTHHKACLYQSHHKNGHLMADIHHHRRARSILILPLKPLPMQHRHQEPLLQQSS